MARTRRTPPPADAKGSRAERYQLRSKLPIVTTAVPSPRVTKDALSPLSTASVATRRSIKSVAITCPIHGETTTADLQLFDNDNKNDDDNGDVDNDNKNDDDNDDDEYDNKNDDDNDDDDSKDPDYKGIDDADEDDDDEYNDDDNLDDYVDDDDGGGKCGPGEKPSMRVQPGQGLYYPDDDALLDDVFDDEYNEKYCTSIPSEAACDRNRNRIAGGPQRPDKCTKSEERFYQRERKAYTDNHRRTLMKTLAAVELNMSPQRERQIVEYTGDQYPHIRLMNFVEQNRLMPGHTFADKTTLQIRIAEEANLRNIKTRVLKSCNMQYVVAGERFYVKASHLIYEGWKVHVCICRENDDTLCIPMKATFMNEKSLRSPFTGKWIGHILRSHLELMPGMSYNHMRSLTENYAHGHLITDNILQEARDSAKKELFGDADDNVRYCEAVKDAIISMGHSCELLFSDRRQVIRSLRATVVREELK